MKIHEIKIGEDVVGKVYEETGESEAIEVWIPPSLIGCGIGVNPKHITITV